MTRSERMKKLWGGVAVLVFLFLYWQSILAGDGGEGDGPTYKVITIGLSGLVIGILAWYGRKLDRNIEDLYKQVNGHDRRLTTIEAHHDIKSHDKD